MVLHSVGDLARSFVQTAQLARMKARLDGLGQELSTGRSRDPVSRLGGSTERLSMIDRHLAVLDRGLDADTQLQSRFGLVQTTLETVEIRRGDLAEKLVTLTGAASDAALDAAAGSAREAFAAIVDTLNLRISGRSLFAGAATDRPALASAEEMLASLNGAVAGAVDGADAIRRVEDWFEAPGGGFRVLGYRGDDGAKAELRLGDGTRVDWGPRADDAAIRAVLTAAALGAVAAQAPGGGDPGIRAALLTEARDRTVSVAADLAGLRGRLGRAEESVATALLRQAAERTALSVSRNDMVAVDPFETASRLQETESRLEMSYAVTARLSRLSIMDYLR